MNIIKLPKITDTRGSLSYLESNRHVPFIIAAVELLTVKNKTEKYFFRNNDADFLLIPLLGIFKLTEINIDTECIADESNKGIYISKKDFSISDFMENTVILILCSKPDFNIQLEL